MANRFQWPDYLVCAVMLLISSLIGLFFAVRARRSHAGAEEMLTGKRNLPVVPVALSLSAGFVSATTILGIPAEVYARGGEQWLFCFGAIFGLLIVAFTFAPFFHRLQLTNAYEYLELRFNKTIRVIGSTTFSVNILIYNALVLYAPAVALSKVTGMSQEISILALGVVCTFYTSVGGIRAVVWTDAFQLVIVWVGLMVLMLKGASDVGGWARVWEVSRNSSRLPEFNMDPNPFIRHTFWTQLIGGGFLFLSIYGGSQTNLQRFASVSTSRGAQLSILLNLPLWVFYLTVLCLLGLVMYTFYETCDPIQEKRVLKPDQLLPTLVLDIMGEYPGLPGLFVSSLFSASISTVSSGINSLAAVALEDIFKPLYSRTQKTKPPKAVCAVATIVLATVFGSMTVGLAYLANILGKTALLISFMNFGALGGPLLGLIINGMFLPFTNSWGAGVGMVASLVVCFYVGIDPIFHPSRGENLPLRKDGCLSSNTTVLLSASSFYNSTDTVFNTTVPHIRSDRLHISYLHYSTIAVLVSVITASLVSAVTCFNRGKEIDGRTYYKYEWLRCTKSTQTREDVNYSNVKNDDHLKQQQTHGFHQQKTAIVVPERKSSKGDKQPMLAWKTTENL